DPPSRITATRPSVASLLAGVIPCGDLTNVSWFGGNFSECRDQTLIAHCYLPTMFLRKSLNRFDLFLPSMARGRPEFRQVIVENGKMLFLLQCFGNPVPHILNSFKHCRSLLPARVKSKQSIQTPQKRSRWLSLLGA